MGAPVRNPNCLTVPLPAPSSQQGPAGGNLSNSLQMGGDLLNPPPQHDRTRSICSFRLCTPHDVAALLRLSAPCTPLAHDTPRACPSPSPLPQKCQVAAPSRLGWSSNFALFGAGERGGAPPLTAAAEQPPIPQKWNEPCLRQVQGFSRIRWISLHRPYTSPPLTSHRIATSASNKGLIAQLVRAYGQ